MLALLPDRRPLTIGFDDAHVSVKAHAKMVERLPDGVTLVARVGPGRGAARGQGSRASSGASARPRELADDAFRAVVEPGIAGRTEREIALALEDHIRHGGAQEPSFPSIVAGGAHGALPHAEPRDEPIPTGTLVVVDWGARPGGLLLGLHADGGDRRARRRGEEVYALVRHAQQRRARQAVRPGPEGRAVDADRPRPDRGGAGHGERFGHGLGHGVGLEVHEAPRLAARGWSRCGAGNVVTVEPGIYLPGAFGVRIEDLVVVDRGRLTRCSAPCPRTCSWSGDGRGALADHSGDRAARDRAADHPGADGGRDHA